MGGATSKIHQFKCSQSEFKKLLTIIHDAHDVSLYYAELLLNESLPLALQMYKNYTKETELYFNESRYNKLDDIDMSYHDFYNQLAYLNYLYESPTNNSAIRRKILLEIFDRSYKIQKHLINELYTKCS